MMNIDESSSSSTSPWHVELNKLHDFFSAMHAHVIDQDPPVSPAYPTITPPSFCRRCGNDYTKGGRLESRVTIDMLPDVALLRVFDFYLHKARIEAWCKLVHVCRNWRAVIFGSPRRLGLRLRCEVTTPVREKLRVWPPLPIVVRADSYGKWPVTWSVDNTIAALEHNDRVYELTLFNIPISHLKKVGEKMQQPFPILTHLKIQPEDGPALVVLPSFLGGSASCLQSLCSKRILFLGLPHLLLAATRLVNLDLRIIPHSVYFSPEVLVTCLAGLTVLERLQIEFAFPRSRSAQNNWRPPPPTRTLLPVLTYLRFIGVGEYMEDFVARINAPLLDNLAITFSPQLRFDTQQLTQFINRTPKFRTHNTARLVFSDDVVWVKLPQTDGILELGLSCGRPDWRLFSLTLVCRSSIPQDLIHKVEHLYILEHDYEDLPLWQNDVVSIQWLQLLYPFTTARDLYISKKFVLCIALAFQELVGVRVTEVLPALETLFFEEPLPSGPVNEAIEQFVSARQLAGHPITISHWERLNFESSSYDSETDESL